MIWFGQLSKADRNNIVQSNRKKEYIDLFFRMFRNTLLTKVVFASIVLHACFASKYHLSGVDITPRRCKGNDDCPSGQCFQGTCVVSYGESAVFSSADAPLGVKDYTPRVAAGPATILYVDKSNKQSKPIKHMLPRRTFWYIHVAQHIFMFGAANLEGIALHSSLDMFMSGENFSQSVRWLTSL